MNKHFLPIKGSLIRTIFSFVLALMALLLTAAPSLAAANTEQDAGPYHVNFQIQPENPLANQPVTVSITLQNKKTGQPVTDAQVGMDMMLMDNSMPGMSMPTSTVIHGQAKMDMAPGMYMLNMMPSQQGPWNQTIHITSPMGEATMTIPLAVGKSGPNWILIGSVSGIVVLAAIAAGIIKRRKE